MKRSPIYIILFCSFIAILILSSLLLFTRMPNQERNGFSRKWLNHQLTLQYENKLRLPLTNITGFGQNSIYFSGIDPRWVLVTDTNFNPIDTLYFSIELSNKLMSPNIFVDSPTVYIHANNISYLITGYTGTSHVDTIKLSTPIFTRSTQISSSLMIVRGFDSTQRKQVFKKINCNSGLVSREADITPNQELGGFETDGILNFDQQINKVIYLHMFDNSFFCLDTNLNVLYKAKTIDTTSRSVASIEILREGQEIKLMPSTARTTINIGFCTNKKYLYVLSGLKADNENLRNFNQNTPLDLYEIENGKYFGSVYLPNFDNKKARVVRFNKNKLIALYDDGNLAIFNLPTQLLD